MASNSAGRESLESVFTVSSRCEEVRRPPGMSTFWRRMALSTSCTVSPRAASACRSMAMRSA